MEYTRVELSQYIVISIWFGCNNNCTICMLSGLKRQLPPISFENFQEVLAAVRREGRFKNLILSGAEVTTFPDLDRFVAYAASLDYFDKIQIQTNGRRLKDRGYLEHLVDCGVNEFFVSIHGLGDIHDATTRTLGAFEETREGLGHLRDFKVNVITNTVLTKANRGGLSDLISFLVGENVSEIHMWNYFPMERTDTKDLIVSLADFVALLPEVLSIVRNAGKAMVFKSFPHCLSSGPPGFFDSLFPVTLLPERFWREFDESGFGFCVYRDQCRAKQCWGLSRAYVHKYGDERARLCPILNQNEID